jgi:hypothetical protein
MLYTDTDSNLYCIVAPDYFPPCCVSQPQRSFGYVFGFLPCRTKKISRRFGCNQVLHQYDDAFGKEMKPFYEGAGL